MNKLFVVLSLVGVAFCGRLDHSYLPPASRQGPPSGPVPPPTPPVPIVHAENNHNVGDGSYNHAYTSGNGIQVQEQGHVVNAGTEDAAPHVQGGYSYTAPNGQQIVLRYMANEHGFQPEGDHLPTAHPIPEHILKSLEQNKAEEEAQAQAQVQVQPQVHQPIYHAPQPQPLYNVPAVSAPVPPQQNFGGYRY